jgi:hypothetical protein
MIQVLGKEKQEFFFDKFLEYFFIEDDAKFFASLGLNCIRLPFNYRHFEDDINPRVLKESGFKHLDRVIDLVGSYPSNVPLLTPTSSAPDTKSTPSLTCTHSPAAKTPTGTATAAQTMLPSGTTKTTKTALS